MTWTSDNSEVVCRELGYAPNGIYDIISIVLCLFHMLFLDTTWNPSTWFNTASEQVDNVVCTGMEPQLRDCSFNITYVESNTAVYVSCQYSKNENP